MPSPVYSFYIYAFMNICHIIIPLFIKVNHYSIIELFVLYMNSLLGFTSAIIFIGKHIFPKSSKVIKRTNLFDVGLFIDTPYISKALIILFL